MIGEKRLCLRLYPSRPRRKEILIVDVDTILVCFEQRDSRWELPIAAEISRCIVAWHTAQPSVDAGMPEDMAEMLSNVLVDYAVVSFPEDTSPPFSFVHTRRSAEVQRAFYSNYFDWTQRGQAIFLSPAESSPSGMSEKLLLVAHDRLRLPELAREGFTGLVLPGVDGDVVGIYAFGDKLLEELVAGLARECKTWGVHFRAVSEPELAEALAEG